MFSEIIREIKNLKTDKKTLRGFCIQFAFILILLRIVFLRDSEYKIYFEYLSAVFVLIGLIYPKAVKYFYVLWMGIAFILGAVVSRIILSITFYLVFTPVGLLLKIVFKKDLLDEKLRPEARSYWEPHEQAKDNEQYTKPF